MVADASLQRGQAVSPIPLPGLGLPWLVSLSPLPLPSAQLPHARVPEGGRGRELFIFDPFAAKRDKAASERRARQALWVCGEAFRAVATLCNPLSIPITIDAIEIAAEVVGPARQEGSEASLPWVGGTDSQKVGEGGSGAEGGTQATRRPVVFSPVGRMVQLDPLTTGEKVELTGIVQGGLGETIDFELQLIGLRTVAYGVECYHPIQSDGEAVGLWTKADSRKLPVSHGGSPDALINQLASAAKDVCSLPPHITVPLVPPLPLLRADWGHAMRLGELTEWKPTGAWLRECP